MSNLLNDMKKNAVVLQKPSATIAIRVDMTAIQRKYYDAMLFIAKQELKKDYNKKTFTVPFAEIQSILSKGERSRNYKYYFERLMELKTKNAEYNILQKDGSQRYGMISLLSDIDILLDKNRKILEVTFELPEKIKMAIIDKNGIYANLNLVIIRGLKSKYAIVLYELIKDYEKVEIPEMTIGEFRKIFGIENRYKAFYDVKKYVLDPAIKELNENENIDFVVSYELKKTGNSYTHIKFHVKPKPAKVKLEQQAKKVLEAEVKENDEAKELLALIPSEHRRKNRVVSLVLGSLKDKGKEYTKAQIEYAVSKLKAGKVKSFTAYLKNAIEKDYAEFEEVEDIGFVTVDDAIGYRLNVTYKGKDMYVEIAHIEIKENLEQQGIGYDKERVYLVRFDNVKTGEVAFWHEFGEEKLFEWARKNIELRKKRRES